LEIGNNVDCIINVAVEMLEGATRMEVCVYEYEYVWKWQIRKRSQNMAIVCTMEMANQTDIRKLGSWQISGWSAMEIWNIRTYLGFFEELGKTPPLNAGTHNCWKYPVDGS